MKTGMFIRWGTILCILIFQQTVLLAEDTSGLKTVEAIGSARIQGDNIVAAREAAISDGLSAAVERVLLETLPVETFSSKFSAVVDLYSGHGSQFAQGYRILAESRSGGFYRVLVQASVASSLIQHQLAGVGISVVSKDKTMPSILLMISEQRLDNPVANSWRAEGNPAVKTVTESLLTQAFTEKGFDVVGHERISGSEPPSDVIYQSSEPTNAQASEVGLQLNSDMVVVGKAVVKRSPDTAETGQKTYKAVITVRSVRSGTAEELAKVEESAVAVDMEDSSGCDKALANAVKIVSEEFSKQMASSRQKPAKKSTSIEMLVEGVSQLGIYANFRTALDKIPGVTHIQVKEMKPDKYTLIVEYPDGAKQLADTLLMKKFDGFAISIPDADQRQLKVILAPIKQN